MPLEKSELLTYLGISESTDSLDDFKSKFGSSFIRKDQEAIKADPEFYGKVIGGIAQGTITALKRVAKKHDIKIEDAALEGKLNEVIEANFDAIVTGYKGKLKNLEESTKQDKEVRYTELEKQFQTTLGEVETWKNKSTAFEQDLTKTKSERDNEIKSFKLGVAKEKLFAGLKWDAKVADNELIKDGFISRLEKKYSFDYDASNNLIILDKDGNKVKNPRKADTYKTPEEVLIDEAVDAKVYAINPHADPKPKPAPKPEPKTAEPTTGAQPAVDPRRTLNTMRPQPAE